MQENERENAVMQESATVPEYLWVFGYGSLMWDDWEKPFGCRNRTVATLPGYRRSFSKLSVANWGTKAAPCPTLNLQADASASCKGMAFAFPASNSATVLAYLGKREGGFEIKPLRVRIDDGTEIQAFVPLYFGKNLRTDLSVEQQVSMIRAARGTSGPGAAYVQGIAAQLKALGIDDPAVRDLWSALENHREAD
jgi:cation transport protein ChaC